MTTYPITQENKVLELNTTNKILANNHYRQRINCTALNQHSSPKNPHNAKIKKEKWATFTYYGPKTRIITRSFKHTYVGIAFKKTTQ
jgi:predicted nucleotidyltransferase